jgi:tetratricopeptide (TPR) repeat protein
LYLNKGDDELANPYIEKGIKIDSSSVKIRQLRARAKYRISDFIGFINDIEYTMAQGDTNNYYQRSLGKAYFNIDSLGKSIDVFSRLLRIGENTEIVKAGLGFAYQKLPSKDNQNLLKAYSNFYDAIKIGTSDQISDYLIALADINIEQNGNEKLTELAIQNYKDIIKKYARPIAVYKLANVYETKLKDHELAIIYFQEYIRMCEIEKRFKYDCRFKDEANQLINSVDKTFKIRKQFPIYTSDTTLNQKKGSLKIDDK